MSDHPKVAWLCACGRDFSRRHDLYRHRSGCRRALDTFARDLICRCGERQGQAHAETCPVEVLLRIDKALIPERGDHTPAPWVARRTPRGIQILKEEVGRSPVVLAEIPWATRADKNNASLIRAAPVLLEALRTILVKAMARDELDWVEVVEVTRAAIADAARELADPERGAR